LLVAAPSCGIYQRLLKVKKYGANIYDVS
jgi:hypothetical protein